MKRAMMKIWAKEGRENTRPPRPSPPGEGETISALVARSCNAVSACSSRGESEVARWYFLQGKQMLGVLEIISQ